MHERNWGNMGDNSGNKKYKHDDIPVIYFNFDSGAWEPENKESTQAVISARYKNQLDEIERVKAASSAGLYESRAMRAAEAEQSRSGRGKRGQGRLPRVFSFYIFLAIIFFVVWMAMQK